MSSKDSWKAFQEQFQKLSDANKSIQNNLKKLDSSKKESDSSKLKEDLCKQLEDATKLLQDLQEKVGKTQEDLGTKRTDANVKLTNEKKKGRMEPEESEHAYQLKAQMMKNVEMQNSKLQTEITLHEKMVELKHVNNQNKKLQEESKLSHTNMVKLLQRFEKKAKETDVKLKNLEEELAKAQRLAFRYKDMYDQERTRNRGKGTSPHPGDKEEEAEQGKTAMPAITTFYKTSNSSSLLGNSIRVNDVIRKNESLVDENDTLKKEVARLRQDNATLLKKTKHANADRDAMLNELETCRMSREDIVKRYQKEKMQHQLLSRTVTRQAQDFIVSKRHQQQLEESSRWRVVYNDRAGPISPYAAAGRAYMRSVPQSSSQSRHMLPVEEYATANESKA